MENINSDLDTLIQNKIDSDSDFQATLADLSDEDKTQAIADKRTELIKNEFSTLAEKAKKADEIALNQKIRAEKAEQELKKAKPAGGEEPPKKEELSLKDIRALQDVHDDDVEHITDYAKFKKISIAEAKKLPEMQAYLKTRGEERQSAEAAHTGGGGGGSSKPSSEALMEKARKGDLPESDDEIKRLMEAKRKEMARK